MVPLANVANMNRGTGDVCPIDLEVSVSGLILLGFQKRMNMVFT